MNETMSSRNGQDQYYNKWERLFKGSSNYQEEQQGASSDWDTVQDVPFAPDNALEKADNVEKGAESEKIEETVPEENLEKLSSGEKTTIYRSENENGEKNVVLESDYFRLARQFRDSHPELKSTDNTEIDLAFMGLSSDLAMIDATHGKNLKNGAENLRESLVDDYSKLRAKFEDPNTPAEDKQLIAEYFETMDGEALSFLKASFSGAEETKRQEEAEKAIKKERFEAELEEVKAQIKRARGNIEDDLEVLDRAEQELDRLLEDHSADNDTDFLRSKIKQMGYAVEDLDHDNRRFAHANSDYGDMVTDGRESEFFDEERAKKRKTTSLRQ